MKNRIRTLIGVSILIIAIILSLSLIKSISKIIGSNQKITDAQNSLNELKKQNEDLEKQVQAAKSTQFIQEEARNKLGLAKKGETVVVLPDTETLKSLAPKIKEENAQLPIPVWQEWLNLFF